MWYNSWFEYEKITQLTDINYLIDEQNNLKNYIYYIKEENSYSFFLLKEDELWFYAIKFNEKIVSIFEKRNWSEILLFSFIKKLAL